MKRSPQQESLCGGCHCHKLVHEIWVLFGGSCSCDCRGETREMVEKQ